MNDNKEFLGTEPVGKLIFKLAIPTVVAQLINMLYNIVDRIFIGRMPEVGSLALTGVGVCMPIILLVSAFASMVGAGGAPRASIFMGRGDHNQSEKILGSCFSFQIIASIVLTILLVAFNRPLLLLFGASENTIVYANAYMNIYAIGTIFVQLTLGMNAFITAQGFAQFGMLTVLIGAVCNIILDPILIFILNMGVQGAALATIISQGVSAVWCVLFLCGKKTMLRLRKENLKINPSILLPCLALGTASFIMQGSESVISVCFNSSLLKYGGDIAVGSMTICTSVMQFAMMPMAGLTQGAQPISSYNFGAKKNDRVKKAILIQLAICMTYSILLWGGIMLAPKTFAGIFTSDPALLAYASNALRTYCAFIFIFGVQIVCQMSFVATGNAICSILVAMARKFVLLLPLIFILPHVLKDQAMAVYTAEPVADCLAAIFTVILFLTQFRKSLSNNV